LVSAVQLVSLTEHSEGVGVVNRKQTLPDLLWAYWSRVSGSEKILKTFLGFGREASRVLG